MTDPACFYILLLLLASITNRQCNKRMTMFSKEDYELSLEKQLRMRMIDDDIDNCDDIEVLRNSLKSTASMLATYQQLLSVAVTKHMEQEIAQLTRSCND